MKEHGICAKCKKSVGCPYADDRIKGCKKFVLEDELELTNEEVLRQCTTEQLAEILVCMAEDKSETKTVHKENVGKCVWWLKQPHHSKE